MKTGMVGRGLTDLGGFRPEGEGTDLEVLRGGVFGTRILDGEAVGVAAVSAVGEKMGGMVEARRRIGEWDRLVLWDLGW